MVNKRIALLLTSVILVALCFGLGSTYAVSSPSIELVFDSVKGEIGDILTATIRINNIENFMGYQVNISYDKNVFVPVNPETGEEYGSGSPLIGSTVLKEGAYSPIFFKKHDLASGMLNFSGTYILAEEYRNSGKPEETGVIGKVGFKIIKKHSTYIKFQDAIYMPNAISGTYIYNWDASRIYDYDVIQPEKIEFDIQDPPITSAPLPTPTQMVTPNPTHDGGVTPEPTPTFTGGAPISPNIPGYSVEVMPSLSPDTKKASASVSVEDLKDAIEQVRGKQQKLIEFRIPEVGDVDNYSLELPEKFLSETKENYKILISTVLGSIEIPANMMNYPEVLNQDIGDLAVEFVIGKSDIEGINQGLKEIIDNRPVIDIDILVDGEKIQWNNPEARIKICIPYVPNEWELEEYEHIVAMYISPEGGGVIQPSGRYDFDSDGVTFVTSHLSKYAVGYIHKTFSDIGPYSWAQKQIEVLASKGIINGTTQTTYTPEADITRADFMILLVKALDLSAIVDSNFDDISQDDYYYEYVGIAKGLNITSGVGDNKFNPRERITRQDMMVLTTNALEIAGKVSQRGNYSDIERFIDKSLVASYAVEGVATLVKEGIVVGEGEIINPKGNASRAEMAAIVYKIYNK